MKALGGATQASPFLTSRAEDPRKPKIDFGGPFYPMPITSGHVVKRR